MNLSLEIQQHLPPPSQRRWKGWSERVQRADRSTFPGVGHFLGKDSSFLGLAMLNYGEDKPACSINS